jgi:uncharacterized protein
MSFEWDPEKNRQNQAKHGIAFEDILAIFDGAVLEKEDTRQDYGETRLQAVGEANGLIFYVIYTYREPNRRIISARLANKPEKELYHEYIKN